MDTAMVLPSSTETSSQWLEGPRRKHRPGLARIQIACQRCRTRKQKCDGSLPVCTPCRRAGTECVTSDRLTQRQYSRGYVEALELELAKAKSALGRLESRPQTEEVLDDHPETSTPANVSNVDDQLTAPPVTHRQRVHFESPSLPHHQHIEEVTQEVTPTSRRNLYLGDSVPSDLSPASIETILLEKPTEARYTGNPPGPFLSPLIQGSFNSSRTPTTNAQSAVQIPNHASPPPRELAEKLVHVYFVNRWPALPVLHRDTFMQNSFLPAMDSRATMKHSDLFMFFIVLALAAVDYGRQGGQLPVTPKAYYNTAVTCYLQGLLSSNSLASVQGLLLMASFGMSEPETVNVWHVVRLAMNIAIELGIHRGVSSIPTGSLLEQEMQKRVFWCAYALDKSISLALGRPFAISESDIGMPLPQNFRDRDLTNNGEGMDPERSVKAPDDLSTFLHIIKLRRLNACVHQTFYLTTSQVDHDLLEHRRAELRGELENWIATAPKYTLLAQSTFQTNEWFSIAYHYALLLLHRPSYASPHPSTHDIEICADASISLISAYASLYAKNKITSTWIALHSLFIASLTMLYTFWLSPDIQARLTPNVMKTNIESSISLFEILSATWPASNRCKSIINDFGRAVIASFERNRQQPPNRVAGAQGGNVQPPENYDAPSAGPGGDQDMEANRPPMSSENIFSFDFNDITSPGDIFADPAYFQDLVNWNLASF